MNFYIKRKFVRTIKSDKELGWFSISHNLVENKKYRRILYGKWFCINANGNYIYRLLEFNPTLKSINGEEEFEIDWLGFIKLNDFNPELELTSFEYEIRLARWYEIIYANLNHPNHIARAAYKLGLVSLILGLVSLLIAILTI